jgi:hypothetical protein
MDLLITFAAALALPNEESFCNQLEGSAGSALCIFFAPAQRMLIWATGR